MPAPTKSDPQRRHHPHGRPLRATRFGRGLESLESLRVLAAAVYDSAADPDEPENNWSDVFIWPWL